MDIERLNELKQGVSAMAFIAPSKLIDKSARENIVRDGNALQDLVDESIARQTTTCPDCGGSGVYQEYDEYDRYTVHACATCDGSGEIARQSGRAEQ